MIGSQVSHYRLSRKLGAGTYGEVFEGEHVHDPELKVAVKLVSRSLAEDARFVEALKRECRALDKMDHTNIVRFRELVVTDGGVAMVLELLDGQDLHARLATGPARVETVVSVIEAILEGLAYAHARGVMHRDIKPSNVFWCDDGRVKLLDFGIARAADGTNATQTGQMIGTLDYMAPERFDERGGSMASDVYAVGLIAWEMLAGKPACPDGEFGRKLGWHLAQGVGDASKVRLAVPACPSWLAEVIAGLAAKNPEARPKDGGDALARLRLASTPGAGEVGGGRRPPPLTVMGPGPGPERPLPSQGPRNGSPTIGPRTPSTPQPLLPQNAGGPLLASPNASLNHSRADAASPTAPGSARASIRTGILLAGMGVVGVLLATCGGPVSDVFWAIVPANNSDPVKVVEQIFAAASSGNADALPGLCDPAGTGDGDVKRVCGSKPGTPNWEQFVGDFSKGVVEGAPTVEADEAAVQFRFGPDRAGTETMNLRRIDGKWYLAGF